MSFRKCEKCGIESECHHSDYAGWFCVDYWECQDRTMSLTNDSDNRFAVVPFDEVDEWYAAEAERLRERAPA